jgi:putative PIN family toxin of toxin-antitoxin system
MRILVDTNIIVSAILFPNSVVAHVWSYVIENHHVIICKHSIRELKAVFQRKFPDNLDTLQHFLECFTCEITDTEQVNIEIPPLRDKTDLPILMAAIAANADILLTGDKDFSDILLYKPSIMTPNTFRRTFM